MGFIDGFLSLGKNINKASKQDEDQKSGDLSVGIQELSLDLDDKELVDLGNRWEKIWKESNDYAELLMKQKENKKYWLGDHYTQSQKTQTGENRPQIDNLIFESVETFLPRVTRQRPEPFVTSDGTPEGKIVAKKVSDKLADIADVQKMKLKVKKSIRHWTLYYLGIIKIGYRINTDEIDITSVRPQNAILDPDSITDECEYIGEYFGEYRKDTASNLIYRFPSKEKYIRDYVNGKLGTRITYIEWWTNEYLFWQLKDEVLGKSKNPHWNYDSEEEIKSVDEFGNEQVEKVSVSGKNFFKTKKIPYAFLSIFNLGENPFDDTNLIEQSLPKQDRINKRVRQIDKNADGTNGGAVVSGDSFTKSEAADVGDALKKGHTVWVPRGDVNKAYKRDVAPALPQFIYQALQDDRNELRGVFGVTGLSPQGIINENTVRGKILVKGADDDRSALIVDHIEQFYDYIFNWIVQMMFVYYDKPRPVSRDQSIDDGGISNIDLYSKPLVVSVKEGSLIPKDRLTERNEAIDLWAAGALDPITFFERLEFPNPVESARRLVQWKTNPLSLFPDMAPPMQEVAQGQPMQQIGEQKQESGSLLSNVPIQ